MTDSLNLWIYCFFFHISYCFNTLPIETNLSWFFYNASLQAILQCFFFLFLIINLYLLIPVVITQIVNPIEDLVIPTGIPTKEAKSKIETHPVFVET